MESYTNELIHETSPYLLQHAHNPVDWVSWSPKVFERAKAENKLVLISVGYSSCHWCHVMEHECFEDEEVAALMNKFFINVKVDREERPDVDQLYMTAVQLMTNKGGWPLNCFTLPDGRPIYGGTYFPKEQWMHVLRSLEHTHRTAPERVNEYANELMQGVSASELITVPVTGVQFEMEKLSELILRWKRNFDHREGGGTHAPKFPLPNNIDFLMDYALNANDEAVLKHVEITLDKMAMGGIYDHAGGGFARYSVDMLWKVPHFEKMLYDNGQLIYTYARAYAIFGKPLYKRVVKQTVQWLEREMTDPSGAFISALDADTEGEEGLYYVWSKDELTLLDRETNGLASQIYNFGDRAYWEEGKFILLRTKSDTELIQSLGCTEEDLDNLINEVNEVILAHRMKRVYPGKDDKCLTSWNAMCLKGLCEAFRVFGEDSFRRLAIRNYKWISGTMIQPSGKVDRTFKNGEVSIGGFLEDYSAVIDALIAYYLMEGDTNALKLAEKVLAYSKDKFFDEKSGMFFFTPDDTELIARKMDINDNVIPAANSVMARNLFYLSILNRNNTYRALATQMLSNVDDGMENYGSGYSNWSFLLNHFIFDLKELLCVGSEGKSNAYKLARSKMQFCLIAFKNESDDSELFSEYSSEFNQIYICVEGSCLMPVSDVKSALETVMNSSL